MSLITKVADLAIAIATDIKSLSSTVSLFDGRVTALETAPPPALSPDPSFNSVKAGVNAPRIGHLLIEGPPIGQITDSSATWRRQMETPSWLTTSNIIDISFSIRKDGVIIFPGARAWDAIDVKNATHYYEMDYSKNYWLGVFVFVFDKFLSKGLWGGVPTMFITYKIA